MHNGVGQLSVSPALLQLHSLSCRRGDRASEGCNGLACSLALGVCCRLQRAVLLLQLCMLPLQAAELDLQVRKALVSL